MNKKLYIFLTILIIIWLICMIYLIVNEEWIEVIKNLLILLGSYFGGKFAAWLLERNDKDER